jgi:hypothetical protein
VLDGRLAIWNSAAIPLFGRTGVVLAAGLALTAAAAGVVLSRSPAVVIQRNGIKSAKKLVSVGEGYNAACQPSEVLPRGTSAIRLSLDTVLGPRIKVRALAGGQLLTYGERGPGWTAGEVTIPVRRVTSTTSGVAICWEFALRHEVVTLLGERRALDGLPQSAARPEIKIEYLEPGGASWWSLAASVAGRMGRGRDWSGIWVAPVAIALLGAIAALMSWVVLRSLR